MWFACISVWRSTQFEDTASAARYAKSIIVLLPKGGAVGVVSGKAITHVAVPKVVWHLSTLHFHCGAITLGMCEWG